MRIRFTCSCGNVLEADRRLAGGQIRCPACGKLPHVPKIPEATPPAGMTPVVQTPPPSVPGPIPAPSALVESEAVVGPTVTLVGAQRQAGGGGGRGLGLLLFVILAGLPLALLAFFRDRIDLNRLLDPTAVIQVADQPKAEPGKSAGKAAAKEEEEDNSVLADKYKKPERLEIARLYRQAQVVAERDANRQYPPDGPEMKNDPTSAKVRRERWYQSVFGQQVGKIRRKYSSLTEDELDTIMREAKLFNWDLDAPAPR